MKEQFYNSLISSLEQRVGLKRAVLIISRASTYLMYLCYPAFIAGIAIADKKIPLWELLVPAVAFILLSVFRAAINSPRPYEKFDITPIENKKTSGKSFPSRHTFSAFIIAFTILSRFPILGSALLVVSVALGVCRILSGVHFIRDVIAGFLFAAAASTVYIFI